MLLPYDQSMTDNVGQAYGPARGRQNNNIKCNQILIMMATSTVQSCTVQYSTVQYYMVLYSKVQYREYYRSQDCRSQVPLYFF